MIRRIARPLLGAAFIATGFDVLRHPEPHLEAAQRPVAKLSELTGLPNKPALYNSALGLATMAAGAALALGKAPRVAGWTLAGLTATVTLAGYPLRRSDDRQQRAVERATFVRNVGLIGGALLAGVDRPDPVIETGDALS